MIHAFGYPIRVLFWPMATLAAILERPAFFFKGYRCCFVLSLVRLLDKAPEFSTINPKLLSLPILS